VRKKDTQMETEDPVVKTADKEVYEWIEGMQRAEAEMTAGRATVRVAVELIRICVELTALRQTLQGMIGKAGPSPG
jgi:hypothetical protein